MLTKISVSRVRRRLLHRARIYRQPFIQTCQLYQLVPSPDPGRLSARNCSFIPGALESYKRLGYLIRRRDLLLCSFYNYNRSLNQFLIQSIHTPFTFVHCNHAAVEFRYNIFSSLTNLTLPHDLRSTANDFNTLALVMFRQAALYPIRYAFPLLGVFETATDMYSYCSPPVRLSTKSNT